MYRHFSKFLFSGLACALLSGCASFLISTYTNEGFYADHKGTKGNTYKGCEIWNTCGEIESSDLYGTDEGSVWGNEGGSVYGSEGESSDVYGDSKGFYGRGSVDTHFDSGADSGGD